MDTFFAVNKCAHCGETFSYRKECKVEVCDVCRKTFYNNLYSGRWDWEVGIPNDY